MVDNFFPLLKTVSRSFYFSLRILPKNCRKTMGMGYLLCRLADTLADTSVLNESEKLTILNKFKNLLTAFPLHPREVDLFSTHVKELNQDKNSSDGRLVQNTSNILYIFGSFNKSDQAMIQDVVLSVIKGMQMDLKVFGNSRENVKALKTTDELEQYLEWIGGEPGRFWTTLLKNRFPKMISSEKYQDFLNAGIQFGKGLQMINILRDLPKDLLIGRCYLPEEILLENNMTAEMLLNPENLDRFLPLYFKLIDQTIARLKRGLDYIYYLPQFSYRLRLAVWWPLMIGLKTLIGLRKSRNILDVNFATKIKRSELYGIILGSFFLIPWKGLLWWEFEDLSKRADSSSEV